MTTAYDFPDLNISPILGEEQSDEEDVERGIDDVRLYFLHVVRFSVIEGRPIWLFEDVPPIC